MSFLSFENEAQRSRYKRYYLLSVGFLLDYNYFKKYCKMIAIDLSKQQALTPDPKAIQQINFTGNLENNTAMFFIIEGAKETVLDFSNETVKALWFYFVLI